MAARRSRKSSRSSRGLSLIGTAIRLSLPLAIGIGAGYLWRSYYPVALPMESKLVADKTSLDMAGGELQIELQKTQRENERLRSEVARLEEDKRRTERELGDLHIRNVLQSQAE